MDVTIQRTQQMERTIAQLQQRWGARAIRKARDAQVDVHVPVISTGFADVDRALGIGGLPKGRLSELIATGTDGQSRLLARTLHQAQQAGEQTVYIDLLHTIDLDYMAHSGLDLSSLAILRPLGVSHALEMTNDLICEGGAGLVVFDRFQPLAWSNPELDELDRMLRDWVPSLSHARCTLLFLSQVPALADYPEGLALPYFGSVRLTLQRQDWRYCRSQIVGLRSQVNVAKNKLGPSRHSVSIEVNLDESSLYQACA